MITKAHVVVKVYLGMIDPWRGDVEFCYESRTGVVPTATTSLTRRADKALRGILAGLHIQIVRGMSSKLLPQGDRGFFDAAIPSWPAKLYGHLKWHAIADQELTVIALADAIESDARALPQQPPFIRVDRRAWVGQQIEAWLAEQKIRVQESMELDIPGSIDMMVYCGLGVSIVPLRCMAQPTNARLQAHLAHSTSDTPTARFAVAP